MKQSQATVSTSHFSHDEQTRTVSNAKKTNTWECFRSTDWLQDKPRWFYQKIPAGIHFCHEPSSSYYYWTSCQGSV